jgi:prepilin peptidase CpaA
LTVFEFVALVVVMIAAFTDIRARRVPNWLTISALLGGLLIHLYRGGWPEFEISLAGAGLALGLLLPVVLLRGLGAGDWKLFGALGAIVGPRDSMLILFFAIMIGGVMALFLMIRHRVFWSTIKNLWALLMGFFIYKLRPHPEISLDNPGLLKLPFAVATALATLLVFTGSHRLMR